MTPAEHYAAAEKVLASLAEPDTLQFVANQDHADAALIITGSLARAQVHATLALYIPPPLPPSRSPVLPPTARS